MFPLAVVPVKSLKITTFQTSRNYFEQKCFLVCLDSLLQKNSIVRAIENCLLIKYVIKKLWHINKLVL